MAFECRKL